MSREHVHIVVNLSADFSECNAAIEEVRKNLSNKKLSDNVNALNEVISRVENILCKTVFSSFKVERDVSIVIPGTTPPKMEEIDLDFRPSCKYFFGKENMKCAVNPTIPCDQCKDYEPK